MPRKKKTIVEETLPDNPSIEQDDIADIVCVLTKVYKLNSGGKSFCFQTTEPVDEVSIQAQYPSGGKFVVLEYNGLNQVINTTHIDIEPKPLTVEANGNGSDVRTQMLMQELAFSRNMMMEMIRGLFNGKQQSASTPLGELAQAMQVVHEMKAGSNPVDLIIKGMELGVKSNGGGGDWKAELVSAAKDVIPAVVQTMGATRQTQQGQQTMIQATPASMIKQGIDWLKPQILGGMTVDLAIGWVIQNRYDPLCQQLMSNAIKGDVNTFIQIDPEIANEPYKTWFITAIQLLKDEYAAAQAQSTDENDNERGNGDRSDVASNESVSVGKPIVTKVS